MDKIYWKLTDTIQVIKDTGENNKIIFSSSIPCKYFIKNYDEDINKVYENDNSLCEILYKIDNGNIEEYVYKLYIDIDCYVSTQEDADRIDKEIKDKFIDEVHRVLDQKEYIKYHFNKDDVIILDATRTVVKNETEYIKKSKHILFPVYLDKIDDIKILFTYLMTKINISKELYDCIDTIPYKKNYQAFRLPFQSKSQDRKKIEGSILNVEIAAKDGNYLITQLRSKIKNIFDIEKVNNSLYGTAKYKCIKRDKKIHDTSPYDMLDVLLLDLPYNYKILQNYSQNDILKIVRKHNVTKTEDIEIFNIYLNTIPNPKEGRYKLSYKKWLNIISIFKKYDMPLEYIVNWTLKSYENDIDRHRVNCENIYNNINVERNTKQYNLLINLCNRYDKELFYKIDFAIKHHNQYNLIPIIDMNVEELQDTDEIDMIKYIGKQTIITNLNVGSGKTNKANDFIINHLSNMKINENGFVIIISNRILYGTEYAAKINKHLISKNKNPVIKYLDLEKGYNKNAIINKYSGLVISIESLKKHEDLIKHIIKKTKYIFLLDEIETILKNITGSTNKDHLGSCDLIYKLWESSKTNVILDAYLSYKSVGFIKLMNELTNRKNNIYIHQNDYNKYPKIFNIKYYVKMKLQIFSLESLYNRDILRCLKDDDKNSVVIFCEEAGKAENITEYLIKSGICEDEILCNTGRQKTFNTPDENDRNEEYFKNKDKFKNLRVWIYNSSILNGISIENKEFTKCFIIISNMGLIGGNDILNAIARSRLNNTWDVYIIEYKCKYLLYKENNDTIDCIKKDVEGKLSKIIEECKLNNNELNEELAEQYACSISNFNNAILDKSKYKIDIVPDYRGDYKIRISKKTDEGLVELERIEYVIYKQLREYNLLYISYEASRIYEYLLIVFEEERQYNNTYKIDTFDTLANDKGNIVNYSDIGNVDEDYKNIDNCDYVKIRCMKNIDNGLQSDHQQIIHNIIDSNFTDTDLKNRLKYVIKDFQLEQILKNLINFKKSIFDKEGNFNPIYLKELITILTNERIFEEGDNLLDNITTVRRLITEEKIIQLDLYNKTLCVCNRYKKSHNLTLNKVSKKGEGKAFITNVNLILKDIGVSYETERQKGRGKYTYMYMLNFFHLSNQILFTKDKEYCFRTDDGKYINIQIFLNEIIDNLYNPIKPQFIEED